jgi:hypothetical protein
MCRELDALRKSIVDYAKEFDPGALIPSQASAIVHLASQIESSAASIKAMAAAVLATGNSWQHEGYRSAAEQLADRTGTTPSKAKRVLDMGRRLGQQPEVARAALSGELSAEQAAIVAEGVAANATKASELIEKARDSSLGELSDDVARLKAQAEDLEARRRRIQERRSLKFFKDLEGTYHTRVSGHPEDGASLYRVVSTIRRRLNLLAREQGRTEPFEALDYDALMTLTNVALGQRTHLDLAELIDLGLFPQFETTTAGTPGTPTPSRDAQPGPFPDPTETPASPASDPESPEPRVTPPPAPEPASGRPRRRKKVAGARPKVIIRVDLAALLRGVSLEGELCHIEGYGDVPVSVIEGLVANGNASLAAVLTNHETLIGSTTFRRRPNAHQQIALDFLYPSCAVKGCTQRAALQYDHRIDWSKTHFTVFDLMDRLCPHHHRLKTEKGWNLVAGVGKRHFVPPTDPRHPGRHPHAGPGPSAPEPTIGASPP